MADRVQHECPDHCHQCPLMRGAIMPMCYGTISAYDDLDLSLCTCDPCDPMIAKGELAWWARHWLTLLRDARRFRRYQKSAAAELLTLCDTMRNARPEHLRAAFARVEGLARILSAHQQMPAEAAIDEGERIVKDNVARWRGARRRP